MAVKIYRIYTLERIEEDGEEYEYNPPKYYNLKLARLRPEDQPWDTDNEFASEEEAIQELEKYSDDWAYKYGEYVILPFIKIN